MQMVGKVGVGGSYKAFLSLQNLTLSGMREGRWSMEFVGIGNGSIITHNNQDDVDVSVREVLRRN